MLKFEPSFAYWPRPQFLGDSPLGFAAWIDTRNAEAAALRRPASAHAIKRLVEEHHDDHARTIVLTR